LPPLHYQCAVDEIARCEVFSPLRQKSPLSEFCAALNVPYEGLTDDGNLFSARAWLGNRGILPA
jgi:hypothetical protein